MTPDVTPRAVPAATGIGLPALPIGAACARERAAGASTPGEDAIAAVGGELGLLTSPATMARVGGAVIAYAGCPLWRNHPGRPEWQLTLLIYRRSLYRAARCVVCDYREPWDLALVRRCLS